MGTEHHRGKHRVYWVPTSAELALVRAQRPLDEVAARTPRDQYGQRAARPPIVRYGCLVQRAPC